MEEKLQEAVSLYNKGEKAQAQKILSEIIQQDPNNSIAWYGLALCLTDKDKKIYCLQRTLRLDPSNQKAQLLLGKLQAKENLQSNAQPRKKVSDIHPVKKNPLPINWPALIAFGVVGIVVFVIILFTKEKPYQPNANDAFSHAAGYALSKMYADNPEKYGCVDEENNEADLWYRIQISDLGNYRYYVIGATKAMNQYCVYEIGYFTATVNYDFEYKWWDLEGDVYISNPCLVVNGSSKSYCTLWPNGWEPDMNWRPSTTKVKDVTPTTAPTPIVPPTPTPIITLLQGGDIGKQWKALGRKIGLINVHRTDKLPDGEKPYGESDGFTQFLIVKLRLGSIDPGYEDFSLSDFWMWAYTESGDVEYKAEIHSTKTVRVFSDNDVEETIAYEIMPNSHNFILCFQQGIGYDTNTGKWLIDCGKYAYQFKFGD